jgi:threonine dehydratase
VHGAFALAEAEKAKGAIYVNPIGDPVLSAGFGTIGLELAEDVPDLTDVVVSIGAGGMISGIATAIKALKPQVRIWGVETEGAHSMTAALAAGQPVTIPITSISSTLGAPAVSAFALAHVQRHVEQVFVVGDAEAVAGMQTIAEEAAFWVEPAAGCLVPAARRIAAKVPENAVLALVLCGNNASLADARKWADRFGAG